MGRSAIKLKVFKFQNFINPDNGVYFPTVEGEDEGQDENNELDELIVRRRFNYKNNWATVLKIIFILFLLLSFLGVIMIIGKEWYLLSHMKEFDLVESSLSSVSNSACELNIKIDCHPSAGATQKECENRACCWNPNIKLPGEPFCYYSNSFTYYNWSEPVPTEFGLSAQLNAVKYSPYPSNLQNLTLNVYFESETSLRVKIFDKNTQRFEVPLPYKRETKKSAKINYSVKFFTNGFKVFRIGESFPLIDTTVGPLIYANQFLEISSSVPSQFIYGLGEVEDTLLRNIKWPKSVLWNHDNVPRPNSNLYGSHPFYLSMEKSGSSHGVFLANSNAMEVILQPAPAVTFRTIGGIIELWIYTGLSPSDVLNDYTKTIGRPFLPPYWSLGFHLCRFNYGSLNHTQQILDSNLNAGIPIDVQWNDLDYMQNQNDFTINAEKFKELPNFVKSLHKRGMHYVPLVDSGISAGEEAGKYPPYDIGLSQDIFIKDSSGKKPFVGKVWNPIATTWPDFSHPNISHYWMDLFQNFYNVLEIDGAWIDMNEPSNFWDGTKDGICDSKSSLDYPPYVPSVDGGKLHYKTICPSAKQYGGSHYDLHNLYGILETIATSKALGDVRSKRQFIISRSTFPGQGHFGGHWTGDVVSSWDHYKKSLPQLLNFGLFGIPMVGADICGFNGNTTVSLCKRWQQLGAFYPFSRNHNTDDGIAQDPVSLGSDVILAAKETLRVRYELLPYIYSLFFIAHLNGTPVARPLFFEFPADVMTFGLETSFLLGPSVLIVPILEPNKIDSIKSYLPSGWWYSHYYTNIIESFGEMRELKVPEEHSSIPILYRGGSVIVKQEAGLNTMLSRKNLFSIHAYLSERGEASGKFYWDDGDTPDPVVLGGYNEYNLKVSRNSLRVDNVKNGYPSGNYSLGYIELRGILAPVSSVTINSIAWETFSYISTSKTLLVNTTAQRISFSDGLYLDWKN